MDFWNRSRTRHHQQIVEPQPKRISTPAGQRLSVILENGGNSQMKGAREAHRESVRRSGLPTVVGDSESSDERSNGSGYSYSVWSDGEKKGAIKDHNRFTRRGGWRRIIIVVALIICAVIALAVGLAVGLKKKTISSPANSGSQEAGNSNSDSTPNSSPTGTLTATTSLPSNFPAGNYSMVTFLDTVQTNCTSDPSTWTCYPYTIYNTSPSKSVATFNWIISASSSDSSKYTITSTDNPFDVEFKNAALQLLDEGKDTERFRFQLTQTRTVETTSLTDDNSAAQCDFTDTSLQAFLYTKMKRTYPDTETGDPTGDPSFPVWPFAVRVEQAVGGGENVPLCKTSNGNQITDGIHAQDAGNLCSCLYKNWRTPT